ncbi:MAG TPA: NADH-quinone oxidoreductase subunit C [Pyrinomonadaceae bacterium]|nr:NADH-quinone oxidoreductase subunit C [Pyrinomonadaceae bacterium]
MEEQRNVQGGQPDDQSSETERTTTPSLIAAALQREHPDSITEVVDALGETTITIPRDHIAAACEFLKTAPGIEFNFLADLCGFDRGPEEEPRFEVNYHLFSTTKHHRVRLKVLLNEDDAHVPSVNGIWRTANWHERETYDLFGVVFDGHPDLRRILFLMIVRVTRCEKIFRCEVTSRTA